MLLNARCGDRKIHLFLALFTMSEAVKLHKNTVNNANIARKESALTHRETQNRFTPPTRSKKKLRTINSRYPLFCFYSSSISTMIPQNALVCGVLSSPELAEYIVEIT